MGALTSIATQTSSATTAAPVNASAVSCDTGTGMLSQRLSQSPDQPVLPSPDSQPSLNDGDRAVTDGQGWAAADRWSILRPTITRLYMEENRTLKETMEIMEREHQFFATARMYKTRIKNWGLDKKFKADEVLVMLQAKKGREVANKPTEFVVRGRKVDPRRMKRYLQRNKTVLDRFDAGEAAVQGPERLASVVQVRTPSPEPAPELEPCQSRKRPQQMQLQRRQSSARPDLPADAADSQSLPQSGPGTPSAGLPGPVRDTERLLHDVRSYIAGSFSAGTWFYDQFGRLHSCKGDMGEPLLLDVWTRLEVVASGMAMAEDVRVFGTLNPAFESLDEIVREECPLLLSRVLRLARKLELLGNRQLWLLLINHISAQTTRRLGTNHILRLIWRQMLGLEVGADEEVLDRAYMLILAEFDRHCGMAVNFAVLETYRDHFETVSSSSRCRSLEAQEAGLQRALASIPPQGLASPPVLGLRLRLRITSGLLRCERGEFDAAEALLSDAPASRPGVTPPVPGSSAGTGPSWPLFSAVPYEEFAPLGPWAIASQHGAMGHVMTLRGDFARAEQVLRQAAALVDGAAGFGNIACLHRMLSYLERLFTDTNRTADAAEIRHRRLRRLQGNSRQMQETAAAAVREPPPFTPQQMLLIKKEEMP